MSDTSSPETTQITHSETDARGAFRLGHGAEMTYHRPREDVMIIDHTLVDKPLRGRGIAHHLYQAMVEFARAEGRKVIPTCSFAVAAFDEHPQDADVLHADFGGS